MKFGTEFEFLTKNRNFDKNKNRNFPQRAISSKIEMLRKRLKVCSKIQFSSKIEILIKLSKFSSLIEILSKFDFSKCLNFLPVIESLFVLTFSTALTDYFSSKFRNIISKYSKFKISNKKNRKKNNYFYSFRIILAFRLDDANWSANQNAEFGLRDKIDF